MRVVPERSAGAQILGVFGGFFVGPFVAVQVAVALVPESGLVQTASVFAFALVFAGGVIIWLGLGVAAVVLGFFASLVRGRRPGPASLGPGDRLVPPGYRAFVVSGVVAGLAVGLLAGAATELSLPFATSVWSGLGLGYGLLLWVAAHYGYLPFDPE